MKLETFFDKFDPLANAPDAVAKMQSAGSAGLRTRLVSENAAASAEPRVPSASAEHHAPTTEPRGWYSRGYLPHFDTNDVMQHVTFHLADSLPKETVELLLARIQMWIPSGRISKSAANSKHW